MARKKPHEEHIDESWLIPYADLMTLLLALFIVLFAASNVDAAKYQSIRESFASAFSNGGALPDIGNGLTPDFPPGQPVSPTPAPTPTPTPTPEPGPFQPDPELQSLYDSLTNYVSDNAALSGNVGLLMSAEGVLITLSSDVWFASGSAALTPNMRSFAVSLADLLVVEQTGQQPLYIIITGHTDDVPISGGTFRSNWQLSLSRAGNFMETMLENPGFDPRYFSARGYGEYEPIASNATPEGRQRNRRVEVLVSLAPEVIERDRAPLQEGTP